MTSRQQNIHTLADRPKQNSIPTIYFAGSIRAGREDVDTYARFVQHLKLYGSVITEHVGDYSLSVKGQNNLSDKEIHDRDLRWLRSSDIVIAEVTTPSLGVGYEIATAIAWRIPVVSFYRGEEGTLSAMIAGSDNIRYHQYGEIETALSIIDGIFSGFEGGESL